MLGTSPQGGEVHDPIAGARHDPQKTQARPTMKWFLFLLVLSYLPSIELAYALNVGGGTQAEIQYGGGSAGGIE